jgi:hypothetical protein
VSATDATRVSGLQPPDKTVNTEGRSRCAAGSSPAHSYFYTSHRVCAKVHLFARHVASGAAQRLQASPCLSVLLRFVYKSLVLRLCGLSPAQHFASYLFHTMHASQRPQQPTRACKASNERSKHSSKRALLALPRATRCCRPRPARCRSKAAPVKKQRLRRRSS